MDKLSIADIQKQVHEFIHSAENHDNKLKLTFVLLNLIDESQEVLKGIDHKDFISEVDKKVNEIVVPAMNLSKEYNEHLKQNQEISEVLTNGNDSQFAEYQTQISVLLKKYDEVIKKLVEARDKLPIEKQREQEKK